MASLKFRGLIAAAFNAFNKDLSINTTVIPQYAKYLADSGIPGVLVHGTTGEGMSLSTKERKTIAEAWVAAVKSTDQHVMVQVGGCSLPEVKDLAKHAEKIGANSLLCLPELYFKPKSALELIAYLKNVAEAAPNTPLAYYHNPVMSGVNVNMSQFVKLSAGQIPTFSGMKYTSSDMDEAYNVLKASDNNFRVFYGAKTLIEPVAALGFDSIIASTLNIFHKNVIQILNAVKANNLVEARRLQDKLAESAKAMTKHGDWIPTMKAAMKIFHSLDLGETRPPFVHLTEAQQSDLKNDLKTYLS